MSADRVVRGVVADNPTFIKGLKRIKDQQQQRQVQDYIRQLLFVDLDQAPAKLHLHQLTGKEVTSRLEPSKKIAVWTIHVVANDTIKASFTLENGTAYFRVIDAHDAVDKNP